MQENRILGDIGAYPRPEKERRNYTDAITQAIVSQAGAVAAGASGAAEIALGQVSRAFAVARATGPGAQLFNPQVLAKIGRDLIERGDSVWVRYGRNPGRLAWVQSYDVQAMEDGTFRYSTGTGNKKRRITPLHVRYTFNPLTGRGTGPLQNAPQLKNFSANLELRMSEEGGGVVGYLLPIPSGGDDESVEGLKSDISRLRGRTAVIETTAAGWGEGRGSAPHQDYQPKRIGPSIPQGNVDAFREAQRAVLGACGVPVELVESSQGTGSREAWRRFLHGTVQPLGRLVEQASKDANMSVTLSWDDLMASDIAGRARAFQSMVNGGMDIEEAAALSGLMSA